MLLSLLPDDPRSLVLGDLLQTAYLDQLEQAAHATHREATLAVRLEKLRASFAAAHKKQEAGDSQFKYGGFHDTEQPLGGYISELRGERTMGTKK